MANNFAFQGLGVENMDLTNSVVNIEAVLITQIIYLEPFKA